MARNVFRNPITDETLKGLPEYKDKTVTEEDTAKKALSTKDKVDTGDIVRQCLGNIPLGSSRKTYVLLYNATGQPVHFHKHHDFHGQLLTTPPPAIRNGQWGFFVHGACPVPKDESSGGVVYRRLGNKLPMPNGVDWMFSWLHNPKQISAYTEIGPEGSFDEEIVWELIYRKLEASGQYSHAEFGPWVSDAAITRNSPTVATYVGVMSLRN